MLEWLGTRRERGNRGWGDWITITDSTDMSLSKLQEIVKDREGWHSAVHEVTKGWTWLSHWTTTTIVITILTTQRKVRRRENVRREENITAWLHIWSVTSLSPTLTTIPHPYLHLSGHRTGKGQFSFQSQRKAMPKNAQTTPQLFSSYTLEK